MIKITQWEHNETQYFHINELCVARIYNYTLDMYTGTPRNINIIDKTHQQIVHILMFRYMRTKIYD